MTQKNNYIILLKNQYIKIQSEKPIKKGHYLQEVKLFECAASTPISDISDWANNQFKHANIQEVDNWE